MRRFDTLKSKTQGCENPCYHVLRFNMMVCEVSLLPAHRVARDPRTHLLLLWYRFVFAFCWLFPRQKGGKKQNNSTHTSKSKKNKTRTKKQTNTKTKKAQIEKTKTHANGQVHLFIFFVPFAFLFFGRDCADLVLIFHLFPFLFFLFSSLNNSRVSLSRRT